MTNRIVCLTDSTDNKKLFFRLPKQWTLEGLLSSFEQQQGVKRSVGWGLAGHFELFCMYIQSRGACLVELPSVDLPSFPEEME